ncbi:uncharacterized protein N7446_006409 [Penicillium canescens]|uniref:F-box domain-containing protein n=1 Tax=Penicillium canescens TaxID=5083 RepID=A0AAD6IK74_PENCN|nr:uncharacterized protein N7446_006409 [Penicillium canescens]KAJ6051773.1 hypothetical protein N7460_002307 [Penicillium canescens]KAJ6062289.1 hypothetical protein N7446_006409 [Penicillium canescens]KAJ6065536.1 hypothetical protein N7444_001189 [Penicillium canescens]
MEDNAELESFRRQWREEVSRRSKSKAPPAATPAPTAPPPTRLPPTRHEASRRNEVEEEGPPLASFDPEELAQQVGELSVESPEDDDFSRRRVTEPRSALEHFERAVEKEAEGNLGDSLSHYRKAYRLDSTVDKTYRNKHYAHVWKKTNQPASTTTPAAIHQPTEAETLPTSQLIASFANLPIPQREPLIEGTPPPPCPISTVPSEVIVEILRHVALNDPSVFGRMALVCKRLAYHFVREQHIWKRICQGKRFGFQGMHYDFACDLQGRPIYTLGERYTPFPKDEPMEIPKPLSSWSQVFQTLPRIRYTGVYISTVNYTRPGAADAYQNTSWNSPIHIVTYYRYLRFYPDGSVVSLLSSAEPVDVVPYFSKENLVAARNPAQRKHQRRLSDHGQSLLGAVDSVPPAAMNILKHALPGRWHLASPIPESDTPAEAWKPHTSSDQKPLLSDERDLIVETEGVESKYMYTMHLSLRSPTVSKAALAGPAPPNPSKNTKLAWKGFWSYNRLTDDWGEFTLRNDRAYVFRRVRGWGLD